MRYLIFYILVFLFGLGGGFFGHEYFYPKTTTTVTESDTSTTVIANPFDFDLWIPDDSSTVGTDSIDVVEDTVFRASIETVYVDSSRGKHDFRYTKEFDFDSVGFSINASVQTDTSVHTAPGLSLQPFNIWYHSQITQNTTIPTQQDGVKAVFGGFIGYKRVSIFAGIGLKSNYLLIKTTNANSIELGYMRTFDIKGLWSWKSRKSQNN